MTNPNDASYPMPTSAYHSHGLTKRELFAAMAMQGLLANSAASHMPMEAMAQTSVQCADALIEALNTPKETTCKYGLAT